MEIGTNGGRQQLRLAIILLHNNLNSPIMIKQVKDVTIVPGFPPTTFALFLKSDFDKLIAQPKANGMTLIRISWPDGNTYEAAVRKNHHGAPLISPLNSVAIHCPPICGTEGEVEKDRDPFPI